MLLVLGLIMSIPMFAGWEYSYTFEDSGKTTFEDSLVAISFVGNPTHVMFKEEDDFRVVIKNKTNERLYYEIGNSTINGHNLSYKDGLSILPVKFDETRVIPASKEVTYYIEPYKEFILTSKEIKEVKKGSGVNIDILIPIVYNGKHFDYDFHLRVTAKKK